MMGVVEAKTMTVTNVLEVVLVLAILYVAYRFIRNGVDSDRGVPVKSPQVW
jgi:hypothetical protein